MEDQGKNTTFAVVESLSGWWELAGVDAAVHDNTENLLARDTVDASPAMPTPVSYTHLTLPTILLV